MGDIWMLQWGKKTQEFMTYYLSHTMVVITFEVGHKGNIFWDATVNLYLVILYFSRYEI